MLNTIARREAAHRSEGLALATAWSLLTLDDADRTYASNEGYADQLDSHYVFDTAVPNHGRVGRGDLAVLRDSDVVLGIGWIDFVHESPAEKIRQRCPECARTGFTRRKHIRPTFKCRDCRAEFDTPTKERIQVRQFVADYSRTFAAVDGVVGVSDLATAYKSQAIQHAIRELDLDIVRKVVSIRTVRGSAYWVPDGHVRPNAPGGFSERLGKVRIGQQRFREQLLRRFGEVCALTGPQPAAALDAAHLYRYSDTPQHDTSAGLLLRRDLHSLFDRWLITIDPDTWRIHVSPALTRFGELARLDGAALQMGVLVLLAGVGWLAWVWAQQGVSVADPEASVLGFVLAAVGALGAVLGWMLRRRREAGLPATAEQLEQVLTANLREDGRVTVG